MNFEFEQYGVGIIRAKTNALDMNKHHEFVEIHSQVADSFIYYGAGTVTPQKVDFKATGEKLPFLVLGFGSRITINDERVVIAAFIGGVDPFRYIYYQYGAYNNGSVDWRKTTMKTFCSTPEDVFDTSSNSSYFVLAYAYRTTLKHWNRLYSYLKLGRINKANQTIDWLTEGWDDIGRGNNPSVSINSSGVIVAVAKSLVGKKQIFYRIARVEGDEIVWKSDKTDVPGINAKDITSISVSVSETGQVTLAYVSEKRSYLKTGYVNSALNGINFSSGVQSFFKGKHKGRNVLVDLSSAGSLVLCACNDGTAIAGLYAGVARAYENWIGDHFDDYKNKKIKEFVFPGSHDATMSISTGCTTFGRDCGYR